MATNREDDEFNKLLPPRPTQTGAGIGGMPTYANSPSTQPAQLSTVQSVQPQSLVTANRSVAQPPRSGPNPSGQAPKIAEDPNAFYGVQASGSDPNQRGPSGFVGFQQAYQANKGAIDQRNAQIAGMLQNQAGQAQRSAWQSGGGESEQATTDRDAALRSLGLLEDEFGRGALADEALGGGLSEFDRMLLGGTQSRAVGQAEKDLRGASGEYERQQALKAQRDAATKKVEDERKAARDAYKPPEAKADVVTQDPGSRRAQGRGDWNQADFTQFFGDPASDSGKFSAFGGDKATYENMTQSQWDNFNMLYNAAKKTPTNSPERKYLQSWIAGLKRGKPTRTVSQESVRKAGF